MKDKNWYHGTIYDFEKFDKNEIGKNTNSKDAKYGFYFSGSISTATSYLHESLEINEREFLNKYGISVNKTKLKLNSMIKEFEKLYGYSFDEISNSFSLSYRLSKDNENFKKDLENIKSIKTSLNVFSYPDGNPVVQKILLGNIYNVNIKSENLKTINFQNKAWDQNEQTEFIKMAIDEGFDGLIFENMQDSGWFGGNGIDDVIIVFDENHIEINGVYIYKKNNFIDYKEIKQKNIKKKAKIKN